MKKSIFLVLFILIFTLLPVIVFAEEDIDTETDWKLAEMKYKLLKRK